MLTDIFLIAMGAVLGVLADRYLPAAVSNLIAKIKARFSKD